jgi:hypothetical protein
VALYVIVIYNQDAPFHSHSPAGLSQGSASDSKKSFHFQAITGGWLPGAATEARSVKG